MNVIITVFCCLDTENVAVPVFGVCILLPVLLQFSGGVLYMYIVAPLKGLFGTRKDKDENYNALFEERFNTRVKKKVKTNDGEEKTPRSRQNSSNNFIRRANSMDIGTNNRKYEVTHEIIEEEIDSDEEAKIQKQFQQRLQSDMNKNNHLGNDTIRQQLADDGSIDGGRRSPPNVGRVNQQPNPILHQHKNRGKK